MVVLLGGVGGFLGGGVGGVVSVKMLWLRCMSRFWLCMVMLFGLGEVVVLLGFCVGW